MLSWAELQRITFAEQEYPTSIAYSILKEEDRNNLTVYVGTSTTLVSSEEKQSYSPHEGSLIIYKFNVELLYEQKKRLNGAIYDLQTFTYKGKSYLVAGVNALLQVYALDE